MRRSDLQDKNRPRHQMATTPMATTPMNASIVPAPVKRAVSGGSKTGLPGQAGLTKRQELWCQHFAQFGDPTAAAVAAGYGKHPENRGRENCQHPAILARVKELVQLRQSAGAPTAVGYIEEIAAGDFDDARKAAVRLKAATTMAHVAGVGPVVQTRQTVESMTTHRVELDPEAVAASIVQLRRLLGYPEQPMIDISPSKEDDHAA